MKILIKTKKKYLKLIFFFFIQFMFFFIFSFKKLLIKDSFKILVISDIHNNINKVKILAGKVKSLKFDFIFCCGDVADRNINSEVMEEYFTKLKNIFKELEKIANVIWVPGNHEYISFFTEKYKKELTKNSENIHKKYKKIDDKLFIVGLGGSLPALASSGENYNTLAYKELNIKNDTLKYEGYPYNISQNDYAKNENLYIENLKYIFGKVKNDGGENIQILYLTHIGPLYSPTSIMVENGEMVFFGSIYFGKLFLKEKNSFIIIHGHSHRAEGFITIKKNKYIFNPGSLNEGHYGIIDIKKNNGKWIINDCTIAYL